jgi:hypothetical protein
MDERNVECSGRESIIRRAGDGKRWDVRDNGKLIRTFLHSYLNTFTHTCIDKFCVSHVFIFVVRVSERYRHLVKFCLPSSVLGNPNIEHPFKILTPNTILRYLYSILMHPFSLKYISVFYSPISFLVFEVATFEKCSLKSFIHFVFPSRYIGLYCI